MRAAFIGSMLFLCAACGDEGHEIIVDLRSDYVPGNEVARVETTLRSMDDVIVDRPVEVDIGPLSDLVGGLRVAELTVPSSGTYRLTVRLVGPDGDPVAERPVVLNVDTDLGVIVILTRDCRGTICPSAGDDPSATVCQNARCIDPRCTPETPETCPPPLCVVDADCPTGAPCSEPVCGDGACLLRPMAGMCATDEWCNPEAGCTPLTGPSAVTLSTSGTAGCPTVTATEAGFAVAWIEDAGDRADLFFATTDASGAIMTSPVRIARAARDICPSVAWTGSEVAVAYISNASSPDVSLVRLGLAGAMLGPVVNLSSSAEEAQWPFVAWLGTELGVVWLGALGGDFGLYYTRVSSAGVDLGPSLRLPGTTDVGYGSFAWTGSDLGVLWSNDIGGAQEILFARMDIDGTFAASPVVVFSGARDPGIVTDGAEFGVVADRMGARFVRLDGTGAPLAPEVDLSGGRLGEGWPSVVTSESGYAFTWFGAPGFDFATWEADPGHMSRASFSRDGAAPIALGSDRSVGADLAWSSDRWGVVWSERGTGGLQIRLQIVLP